MHFLESGLLDALLDQDGNVESYVLQSQGVVSLPGPAFLPVPPGVATDRSRRCKTDRPSTWQRIDPEQLAVDSLAIGKKLVKPSLVRALYAARRLRPLERRRLSTF